MGHRFHGSLVAVAVAVAAASLISVTIAAQAPKAAKTTAAQKTWTPPRTSDGQPSLEGVWANNNVTPLERPKQLAGRQYLTEEELAALKRRADELFNGEGDAAFGDRSVRGAADQPRQVRIRRRRHRRLQPVLAAR